MRLTIETAPSNAKSSQKKLVKGILFDSIVEPNSSYLPAVSIFAVSLLSDALVSFVLLLI